MSEKHATLSLTPAMSLITKAEIVFPNAMLPILVTFKQKQMPKSLLVKHFFFFFVLHTSFFFSSFVTIIYSSQCTDLNSFPRVGHSYLLRACLQDVVKYLGHWIKEKNVFEGFIFLMSSFMCFLTLQRTLTCFLIVCKSVTTCAWLWALVSSTDL